MKYCAHFFSRDILKTTKKHLDKIFAGSFTVYMEEWIEICVKRIANWEKTAKPEGITSLTYARKP